MLRKLVMIFALIVPGVANAEWTEATSKHFVVYSDADPADIQDFTKKLEIYDKALRELWGLPDKRIPATQRVTIFTVDNVSEIQRLLPGRSAAGFYTARVSGPVAFVPQSSGDVLKSAEVLRHEYAHQFMFANWTNSAFPAWFSEGFAEFCATADFRSDGSVTFGAMPRYRNYLMLRSGTLPLDTLLKPSFEGLSAEQVAVAYSRGWLLTHYLLTQPEERGNLIAYLKAFNNGEQKKARQALDDISDMRLSNYIQRNGLPSLTIDSDRLKVGDVTLRALTQAEAATMPARIRSTAGVTQKTASEVAELAKHLAAPYPHSAPAQRELAEAEFDAENYDASMKAAERAIAANPDMADAYIYRGMAEMAQAENGDINDDSTWNRIRSWFLKANKVDTENPRALYLFYESFGKQGVKPTKNAKDALLYAYHLAPYDMGLRLEAGDVLLGLGAGNAARAALRPVAYSPHGGEIGKAVRKALDIADESGPKEAAAYLQKQHEKAEDGSEEDHPRR